MKTWLFVDGYNIIGAWPELTQLRDQSLEEARKKVIDYLSEYAAATGYETVLVSTAGASRAIAAALSKIPILRSSSPRRRHRDMAIERLVAGLAAFLQVLRPEEFLVDTVAEQLLLDVVEIWHPFLFGYL